MKIALVHDWLTGMRGGERVLERWCGLFPGADLHTLVWKRGSTSAAIESHPIRVSALQYLPAATRAYRWYLPLFPRAIRTLSLGGYDAVLSSSHAAAKAAPVPPDTFHLSYLHTPMRYVWELEHDYFPPGRFPWPVSAYVRATCASLRRWDVATSGAPHAMLANSAHVAGRIARHYGRSAAVVHPPVDLARFDVGEGARDYYLVAGAFAPYKRADLAIEACRRLGRPVKVAGAGQEARRLARLSGGGVEFLGWLTDDEMAALYRGARALVFPGEEDFGIVPLEAMASGCPVVALGRGGALETVGRGATPEALATVARGGTAVVPGGVLFGEQSVAGIVAALERLETTRFEPRALRAHAEPFSPERFDREFMAAFTAGLEAWRRGGGRAARNGGPAS